MKIDLHKVVIATISVLGAASIWYYVRLEMIREEDSANNCLNITQELNNYPHDNRKRNTGDCSE